MENRELKSRATGDQSHRVARTEWGHVLHVRLIDKKPDTVEARNSPAFGAAGKLQAVGLRPHYSLGQGHISIGTANRKPVGIDADHF